MARSHGCEHDGGCVPHGKGGWRIDRPQLHEISSKIASRQVLHGPLWQISGQVWRPHFSVRPHTRVQMCSASTSSSDGRRCDRSLRRMACRSRAFCSPEQQRSLHECRPQCRPALQIRGHCGCCAFSSGHGVVIVLRPQRQVIAVGRIQMPQEPVWHTFSQVCPHGIVFPHFERQWGIGSSQDMRAV